MVQAALIGQTFGMLTGRPKDLLTVQTFHGTIITWGGRKYFMNERPAIEYINMDDLERAPEKAWRAWSQTEEQIRLWAAISLLDAEFSELFLGEPLLRRRTTGLVADDDLWLAPTVQQWCKMVRCRTEQSRIVIEPSTLSIGFRAYVILGDIGSAICDANAFESKAELLVKFQPSLIKFYEDHLHPLQRPDRHVDKFCLQALWHANFLTLLASLDRLEKALGREGFDESQRHVEYARDWACSSEGLRCAIHAVLILHLLERLPVGVEPAIHIPRVLFRAMVVWFCYINYGKEEWCGLRVGDVDAFPELTLLKVNSSKVLFEAQNLQYKRPSPTECITLCRFADLLGRIGHWGLSRKLSEVWEVLLHGALETNSLQTSANHRVV
ncbi:hypothetical protein BDV59DRAFT_175554 [Aspergillus ambiguus]|uniref:uncharacterized protein n=1 Tax=Aspergillus ambiguus TaxID=176160 RepID=UPI003CCDC82B